MWIWSVKNLDIQKSDNEFEAPGEQSDRTVPGAVHCARATGHVFDGTNARSRREDMKGRCFASSVRRLAGSRLES